MELGKYFLQFTVVTLCLFLKLATVTGTKWEWRTIHEKMSPGIVSMNQIGHFSSKYSQGHRRQVPTMIQPDCNSDSNQRNITSCSDDKYSASLATKFQDNVFSKTFVNDSYTNITVLWTGKDDSIIVAVTINSGNRPSTLYISEDFGKNFKNYTKVLNNMAINYVQQCPSNRKSVILVSSESAQLTTLFLISNISHIRSASLPFKLNGEIRFHPTHPLRLLALGGDQNQMWKAWSSNDGGFNWNELYTYVNDIQWSQHPNADNNTFYFTTGNEISFEDVKNKQYDLVKMNSNGAHTVVAHRVSTFEIRGKFIYALVYADDSRKKYILRVSTNSGSRWNEAQLPVRVEDQFYKVLDMSDGMVFIHVDLTKDHGYGTLFTSDSDGIVFSESLRFHTVLRDNELTDFYKVKSMRGVYISNHLAEDHHQRSVITFNRGAKWRNLRTPSNVNCQPFNISKCYLQITSRIDARLKIPPLSAKGAAGIILAHGYLGYSIPSGGPDVYISSDGGYNWLKALNGPHIYAIADHGGLLVAVSISNYNILKYSLDEGQTWYCYRYTKEKLKITGLLTDPESWSLKVGVWGYGTNDSVWRVTVIDFLPIIERRCAEPDDFTDFLPHNEKTDGRQQGCLLGISETFRRVKKGKKCYLGQDHKTKKSTERCKCTEDDYECDYGFYRSSSDQRCVEGPNFKGEELDICLDGDEKKIVTYGYRRIPGDVCTGGFDPGERYEKSIKIHCREGDKILIGSLRGGPTSSTTGLVILILLIMVMTGLIFGMSVFFIRKFNQVNHSPISYRYTRLNQDDLPDESILSVDAGSPASGETTTSDDEEQTATLLVDSMDTVNNPTVTINGSSNRVKIFSEESDEELLQ